MGKIMVFVPLFVVALLHSIVVRGIYARGILLDDLANNSSEKEGTSTSNGTTWAVLVAGSSDFDNYRHQADVCHAYQLLKKGGLKDENIVVFMYDDIANNPMNPKPGVIINKPGGPDVYAGVPKDYTGNSTNTKNLYAVLLGDKNGTKGGSGKVVDSKPGDRIFLYYADHGAAGSLAMPSGPMLYADDFIKVLKKKHKMRTYKEMVIYVEACESGSLFEGLLPTDLNIYAMTASNAEESSWATYCPDKDSQLPPGFDTCLGDLFSVSWLEDSEAHNLKKETIKKQYEKVKNRTSVNKTYDQGSHVMEYGTSQLWSNQLYLYQGFNPANANITEAALPQFKATNLVDGRDVQLLFLRQRYKKAKDNSNKATILKKIRDIKMQRLHVDSSVENIGKMLFGSEQGANSVLSANRSSGQPLVDDWDCLRGLVGVFEDQCGPLKQYGKKYMRAFANICNYGGVTLDAMKEACMSACKA